MALDFDGANGLNNIGFTAVAAAPITFAAWVYATGTTQQAICAISDNTVAAHYLSMEFSTQWHARARDGGVGNVATAGTVTANQWAFVVARFLTSTNRWIQALEYDGTYSSAQNTNSRTPAGINTMSVGNVRAAALTTIPMSGYVAEYWWLNGDIQGDANSAVNESLMRQLARRGPFSVPYIASAICEYRSFRIEGPSNYDRLGEVYWNNTTPGRQSWSYTSPIQLAAHPPLAANYAKPADFTQNIEVIQEVA